MPNLFDVALRNSQWLAHGNENLLLNEVDACHFLGHRMLDLDTLVHFQEIKIALLIHHKLHGPCIGVSSRLRQSDRCLTHLFAQVSKGTLFQEGRWGFFDEFLVPSLDRTVSLSQMDDFPLTVSEDLVFDMARVLDEFLDIDSRVAKGFLCLGACRVVALDEGNVIVNDPHASSSPSCDGLDQNRVTDFLGSLQRLLLCIHQTF